MHANFLLQEIRRIKCSCSTIMELLLFLPCRKPQFSTRFSILNCFLGPENGLCIPPMSAAILAVVLRMITNNSLDFDPSVLNWHVYYLFPRGNLFFHDCCHRYRQNSFLVSSPKLYGTCCTKTCWNYSGPFYGSQAASWHLLFCNFKVIMRWWP